MPRRTSTVAAAVAAALMLAAPARAAAPDEQARRDDVRKLLKLTGAGSLGVQFAQQMMGSLKVLVPNAPESFWKEFAAQLDPDELVEKVVPIYAKNLSAQDVKDLIAFYESPAGRHFTAAQPVIMQESMAAGQAWGQDIARRAIEKAKAKGFEVRDL